MVRICNKVKRYFAHIALGKVQAKCCLEANVAKCIVSEQLVHSHRLMSDRPVTLQTHNFVSMLPLCRVVAATPGRYVAATLNVVCLLGLLISGV